MTGLQRGKRMILGEDADVEDLPYLVQLHEFKQNLGGYVLKCSGTLIASRWVLTAAQCLEGVTVNSAIDEHVILVYGSKYRESPYHMANRHDLEMYYSHNKYNPQNKENDIALLQVGQINLYLVYVSMCYTVRFAILILELFCIQLKEIVDWTIGVKKSRLPRAVSVKYNHFAVMAGWRLASDGIPRIPQKLTVFTIRASDYTNDEHIYRNDWILSQSLGSPLAGPEEVQNIF